MYVLLISIAHDINESIGIFTILSPYYSSHSWAIHKHRGMNPKFSYPLSDSRISLSEASEPHPIAVEKWKSSQGALFLHEYNHAWYVWNFGTMEETSERLVCDLDDNVQVIHLQQKTC